LKLTLGILKPVREFEKPPFFWRFGILVSFLLYKGKGKRGKSKRKYESKNPKIK